MASPAPHPATPVHPALRRPTPAARPAPRHQPRHDPREQTRVSYVDTMVLARAWSDRQVAAGRVDAAKAREFWSRNHGHDYLDKFKSLFPAGKDTFEGGLTIRVIIAELGITGRYFLKTIKGREHVVFKGFAGAREVLTGTHYGINHHKILELKMTKGGMKAAAREGLIFGVLFCTVVDIVDFAMNDRATWGSLIGTLSMDIAKGLLATGAAYALGVVTAAAMGASVIALGPVVVVLVVGVGAGFLLDWLDNKLGVTEKLGKLCDQGLAKLAELGREIEQGAVRTYHQIENSQVVRDLSRETRELANWAGHYLPRLQYLPARR